MRPTMCLGECYGNLLKLLRDKGISSKKLELEEFNSLIRYLFNENLNEFTFEQYNN